MLGRHHAATGAITWITGCALTGVPVASPILWLGTPIAAAAALLPDIDHEGSLIGRCGGIITRLIARTVRASFGHRGATHTLLAAILTGALTTLGVGLTLGWASWWAGVAVGGGVLTHILGDACTEAGVPLLWPWTTRMVGIWRPLRFRTGKWFERLCVGPIILAVGVLAVWLELRHGTPVRPVGSPK